MVEQSNARFFFLALVIATSYNQIGRSAVRISASLQNFFIVTFLALLGRDPISIGMDIAEANPTPTLCDQEGDLADLIN